MRPGRGAALAIAGCAICQIGLGFTYLFDTYLRDIVAELGWSRASFSAAHASRLVVLALASPLAGWATERLGPRVVLGSGLVLLGSVGVLYGQMSSLWQLWVLSLSLGLVMAALGDVAVASVVARWMVGGRRGLALGVVYSGSNLGGVIAVLASAPIVDAGGWRASLLYLVAGGSALLLPLVLWMVRVPDADALAATGAPASRQDGQALASPSLALGEALRTRSFWLLFGGLFLFYFYYIAVLDHLVAFLQDIGLSRTAASQAFGVTIVLGIGSKLGAGLLVDRVPARVGLLINFAILALASALLLLVPASGFLLAFVIAHGVAVAAQNVTYPMAIAACFGTEHLARIYGALMLALMGGGLLGSAFAGAVHDHLGSYRPALVAYAMLNVVALGLLSFIRPEARPTSAAVAGQLPVSVRLPQ